MISRFIGLALVLAVLGGCASVKEQVRSAPRVAVVSALPTLVLPRTVFGDSPLPSGWTVLRPALPAVGSVATVQNRRFLDLNAAMTDCIRATLNRDAKIVNARDHEPVFFEKEFTVAGNREQDLGAVAAELVRLGREWDVDCIVLIQDGAREMVTAADGTFGGTFRVPLLAEKTRLWVTMEAQFTVFDCKSRKFVMRETLIARRLLREGPKAESPDAMVGELDVFYREVMTAALVEVGLSNEKNPFDLQPRGNVRIKGLPNSQYIPDRTSPPSSGAGRQAPPYRGSGLR